MQTEFRRYPFSLDPHLVNVPSIQVENVSVRMLISMMIPSDGNARTFDVDGWAQDGYLSAQAKVLDDKIERCSSSREDHFCKTYADC